MPCLTNVRKWGRNLSLGIPYLFSRTYPHPGLARGRGFDPSY